MRREELYLSDILEAADAIEKFLADLDKDAFINSDLIRSAVLQKLTIIGEATARLPKAFKQRNKDIDWADIIAFRNLTVHAYFSIDWSIVWTTAAKDVPEFKEENICHRFENQQIKTNYAAASYRGLNPERLNKVYKKHKC